MGLVSTGQARHGVVWFFSTIAFLIARNRDATERSAMSVYLNRLFGLHGRTALVTGAAAGNGTAIAEALARAGARVVMLDKDEDRLFMTEGELKRLELDVKAVHVDITNKAAVFLAITSSEPIDILVNNAGISNASNEELTMRVNYEAPRFICSHVAPSMVRRGKGSIINVTSLGASLGFPNNPAYQASKAALAALTRSIALDYGPRVRCNNLQPGYFKTSMTDQSWNNLISRMERTNRTMLGRWGEPSDLAGAVVFLASDASSYMTGSDLVVDGGWTSRGL